MNISPDNFCTVEEIKADVLVRLDDQEERKLSPGYYVRQIKKGLEELSFMTYFNTVFLDLTMPKTLNMPIPKNMWNIKDIFVWKHGSVDCNQPTCDDCSIQGMERVFYKRNFISKGKGYGYTARNHENSHDPFMRRTGNGGGLKWYNVVEGIIMLSESCDCYDRIRIVANGLMTADVNKVKVIPIFVRQAVTLWATCECAAALKKKDPTYRVVWADTRTELYSPTSRQTGNVWDEAQYRLKKRDKKEQDDWNTYLGVIND
jgi:hypothetical protein